MQDMFDFQAKVASPMADEAGAILPLTLETIAEGLTAVELAWGREVLVRYSSATGRKNWFSELSQSEELRFCAAVFRVARIKREGLRLSRLGQPRESVGWIQDDPELALATQVLSAGFVHDGELPLLAAS